MRCGGGWHYPYSKLLGFSTEIPSSSFSIGWNNNDSNLNMTLWFCGMSAGRRLSHPQNFVLGYVNSKIYQDPKWLFAIRLCYCIVTLFFLAGDIFQDAFPRSWQKTINLKNNICIRFKDKINSKLWWTKISVRRHQYSNKLDRLLCFGKNMG